MEQVKLRNKQAEAEYFRMLGRWRAAIKNLDDYDEKSLHFLWRNLESAWNRIGYVIGDKELDETKTT